MGGRKHDFSEIKKIRKHELEQRLVAVCLEDIPIAYELISNEWLSRILCPEGTAAAAVDHRLDEPDNGTSNRRRIFVTYNDVGSALNLPKSVFCKATQSIQSRFVIGLTHAARSEIRFFNSIRGDLDIEAPVCLHGKFDDRSLNSIIMFEDLGDSVSFCDYDTPVSVDMAKSQMRLLAKFHSQLLESPKLEEFVTCEQFFETASSEIQLEGAHYRGMEVVRHVTPRRLLDDAPKMWPAIIQAYLAHANLSRTLVHGDVHLKNWYVTADGEMGLADWQCCVRGHWSRDLAYALSVALTVDNRRMWERDLITYYIELMSAAGVQMPSTEEVLALYGQQLLGALMMWTTTLGALSAAPDMQPKEASVEFIKRILHAIDDWGVLR